MSVGLLRFLNVLGHHHHHPFGCQATHAGLPSCCLCLGFPVCMGYEDCGIDPPLPLSFHMIISQGRKPPELPESEELPRHVGWRWDGGAVPGWPRACGGGSQLLLRATVTGNGPEACSPNPLRGVLSVLRSGLVAIDPEGDPAFRSSLSGRPGLCLWKK